MWSLAGLKERLAYKAAHVIKYGSHKMGEQSSPQQEQNVSQYLW